jgi:hypothetical protein
VIKVDLGNEEGETPYLGSSRNLRIIRKEDALLDRFCGFGGVIFYFCRYDGFENIGSVSNIYTK